MNPADDIRYIPVTPVPPNVVPGTPGDDTLMGSKDSEFFVAGPGSDIETGDGGNDVFLMGPGRDFIGGGGVSDSAIFEGFLDDHDILPIPESAQPDAIVTDTNPSDGDSGMDRLSGVETYEFKDALVDAATGDITPKTDGTFSYVPVTAIPMREGFGTDAGERLVGSKADEFFDAGDGRDTSTGDGGSDVFLMGEGDDFIGGGGGVDTAIFDGLLDGVDGDNRGQDGLFLTDNNPSDGDTGTDRFGGVEFFEFKDALVDFAGGELFEKTDGTLSFVPAVELPTRPGFGTILDDRLEGGKEAEFFDAGAGSDVVLGDGGDDVFLMGEGRDFIGGGGGNDTAIFDGIFKDYDVQKTGELTFFVTDENPGDGDSGRDRLGGVEIFEFKDGILDTATGAFSPKAPPPPPGPDLAGEFDLLAG